MKRILLSLLFALVALTGLQAQTIWDGTADTSWYNETSTEFEISTAEQLAGLAELVNNGNDFSGKTILLTADIVLNDTSDWENWENSAPNNTWTPIGNSSNKFSDTFDGQGHTVSGVYINSENKYQGLFGHNEGTIKNIGVTESYIKGEYSVGGVCGLNNTLRGTISNCYNSGSINGTGEYIIAGGVCGENNGTISNSYNSGTVIGNCYVGGVCGSDSYGTISNCYNTGTISGNLEVGGVCGWKTGTISNCYNTGTINGNENVGGVCGFSGNGSISNCYNTGTINGDSYVGGVCGYNYSGTISNCYNSETVSGNNDNVGGVCGYNNGTISNCYNTGTISGYEEVGGVCGYNNEGTISDCYNSGIVSGDWLVGSVCGGNWDGSISNCYYLEGTATGGINGNDVSGQAEVKTAEQFASGEVCWLLNEEQSEGAWGQKLGTDPCPVLGGPAVFKDGDIYYNEKTTAIEETNNEQASFVIVSENLTIKIYGSDHEATVYNLAGNIVYHGSERIIPVHNPGIYMVRIGNEVQKTIVR